MKYTLKEIADLLKEYNIDEIMVSDEKVVMKRDSKGCYGIETSERDEKMKTNKEVKAALAKEAIREETQKRTNIYGV